MPIRKFFNRSKKVLKSVQDRIKTMREQNSNEEEFVNKKIVLPEEKTQRMVMEISLWSATKVILLILGFLVLQSALVQILDILLIFFVSLFLAAAFNPGVDFFERRFRFPRWLGVIAIYIIILGVLSIIVGGVVPILIDQVSSMAVTLKDYLNGILNGDSVQEGIWTRLKPYAESLLQQVDQKQIVDSAQKYMETVVTNLGNFASNTLVILITVVNGIFNFILILLLTFFMIVEREGLHDFFASLFPKKYEDYITHKTHAVQKKVGDWVHGQIALFIIVGLIAFIGLKAIGIIGQYTGDFGSAGPGISQYALTLALVAGLAEFLPYVGPLIAFLTAAPVAFNDSAIIGLSVIGFYVFLQFVEGNFIVPMVMKKAVGLSPIVTIVSMLIGWQFLGIWGMILSVPVASIMALFVSDFTGRKNR